ncbi:hypothetical protein TBLA_0C04890 [Henningerozyma blattae CBS 6284]|uniref:Sm protein B n=1 Tax=Henningerozyma blattae (strain ATCC 34711 / CBS 6284 / DSM 70876 / NBRC 10599 / NRRL Y-10934 / UCD 77-7) TaxID=1071380 RepID=I2H1N3_HENB6|nr:hypothetical protein TBLA_0C04890 [Tetrapisispora blattae CBS 6284]CCH60285.1 hypothetical protein TBLA_0C04890 [Tetrapisispora blattae CBS 6284]
MNNISVKHNSRLSHLINYKIRVITIDDKVYIGELLSFDNHMNLILNNCIEQRIPKTQLPKLKDLKSKDSIRIEKRTLGLIILRGDQILTTMVEDKPLLNKSQRLQKEKQQSKIISKNRRSRYYNSKTNKSSSTNTNENKKIKNKNNNVNNNNNANTRPAGNPTNKPVVRKFQPPPGFVKR